MESHSEFSLRNGASSVEAFKEEIKNCKALDVVLCDIGLPGASGIEGVKLIKQRYPDCEVVMITTFTNEDKIFQVLCAGATGYLQKK